jgi:hypothetical protein
MGDAACAPGAKLEIPTAVGAIPGEEGEALRFAEEAAAGDNPRGAVGWLDTNALVVGDGDPEPFCNRFDDNPGERLEGTVLLR